jgi:hypothetical protein
VVNAEADAHGSVLFDIGYADGISRLAVPDAGSGAGRVETSRQETSDIAALAEVFSAMPLAFVRLVPFALRHFVAFAGDGVLRLVLHGLGNAGTLLVRGLSHVGCVTRPAAHGGAETLVGLNEIRGPVVGDHRNGSLGILGVECNADQGTQTRSRTAMA